MREGLDVRQKLHLFRICQDVMTNVIKHADANSVQITFRLSDKYCALKITDDGNGIVADFSSGLGMKNIALRSQLLGGQYKISPFPQKGTSFMFLLKLIEI